MRIYLDVPYIEKDKAKDLGAKWNAKIKKWYADTTREDYVRYSRWILGDSEEVIIAIDYIFVIEGMRRCWKCGNQTRVVGLGIGDFLRMYEDDDDEGVQYEIVEECFDMGEEIHLAWSDCEEDIPPKLLQYLKENYSVKIGYSKTAGKCFANHCDCCGAIQGNWFLFDEPDSPLSSCVGGEKFIERTKKLKIKGIPIEDDLKIDWYIGFCCNDYGYFEYGKFEELVLSSDLDNKYISYEELYEN